MTVIEACFKDTMVEFFTPGNFDDLLLRLEAHFGGERLAELSVGSAKLNGRYNWPKTRAEHITLVERLGNQQNRAE
jgi:hypothetical protein